MESRTSRARYLRKNMTDAERTLWRSLRQRQLRYKFRRQRPIGEYIVDFACLYPKLIVEVDGGQHQWRTAQDLERTQRLEAEGYTVLRFWNNEVLEETDSVLDAIDAEIRRLVAQRGAPPS